MIVVHHLNNSRSQRVLWLLEELGVPYEIKHYARDAKTIVHANAHHMTTVIEDTAEAIARIKAAGNELVAIKRL